MLAMGGGASWEQTGCGGYPQPGEVAWYKASYKFSDASDDPGDGL